MTRDRKFGPFMIETADEEVRRKRRQQERLPLGKIALWILLLVVAVLGFAFARRWYRGLEQDPVWAPTVKWLDAHVMPHNPEQFWTFVAAAFSIGVFIAAWKGLRSLRLTRHELVTRAEREGRQCAISRCEELADEIIPQNTKLLNAMAEAGVPPFVSSASELQFDPDNPQLLNKAIDWFNALKPELRGDSILLLNRLEAWSMYFTQRLADPEVAFKPAAPFVVSTVAQLYAVLLIMRSDGAHSGKYPNLVELFQAWRGEMDKVNRGKQVGELLERVRTLQREGTPSAKLQRPLGTDLDL